MSLSVLYFGTPEFAVPPLEALIRDSRYNVLAVITQPDQPAGRGRKLTPPPVKKCAEQHGIPVFQPNRLRKEWKALESQLTSLSPHFHVGVVCAYGQILPAKCLGFPESGCVNIHASLLPRWRGAAPIQRAIMAGDAHTGISLMQMDEGLDTGPWYVQATVPILESTTAGELHDRLSHLGAELLSQHLYEIASGTPLTLHHQDDDALVTYAPKIEKAECTIEWTRPATELHRHIHGLSPYPGAFTYLEGKRLKILQCAPREKLPHPDQRGPTPHYPPGTVIRSTTSQLEICCGHGVLALLTLQIEGKGVMNIEDFLRGNPIPEGIQLTHSPTCRQNERR